MLSSKRCGMYSLRVAVRRRGRWGKGERGSLLGSAGVVRLCVGERQREWMIRDYCCIFSLSVTLVPSMARLAGCLSWPKSLRCCDAHREVAPCIRRGRWRWTTPVCHCRCMHAQPGVACSPASLRFHTAAACAAREEDVVQTELATQVH